MGDAEVLVSPDKVSIHTGVEHWDRSLTVAKKQNEDVLKKVFALAEEFKIPKDSIQIDHIGVEVERKGWNEKPMHQLEGYFVRRSLTFILKDLSRFDDFLGKLLEVGVNQIHGVSFQTSDLRKHRDAARELAVKAAAEKAMVMAKAIGQKAGKAITIKEEQDSYFSPYNLLLSPRLGGAMQNSSMEARSNGEPSVPGKISIKASISATFHLD